MRKRDRSLLSNATALLVCGLLAGVVVAAAAFPAVAMSGLAAKAGADQFADLPAELTVQQTPQVTNVYASDHKTLIATFYDENRRDVSIDKVALVMQEAMVASEDTRFYQHHGVDIKGVARAFVADQQAGQTSQGASTLTMQYVRQAIEYSASTPQEVVDATSDTPGRKLREMRYALALEKELTKKQILEKYLNVAPFGNNAYGIYSAAEVYFGKQPKDLTLGEATLLAGLVQAPTDYNPATKDGLAKALTRRNNYVLDNMVKMGYITDVQKQQAIATKLKFVNKQTPNGCASVLNNSWGFFCDYLYRWWLQQPAFGADQYERQNRLMSGGYTIYTSLDVHAQAAAMKNIKAVEKTSASNPDALMLAGVEPGTGHIQIMAVNRTYSNNQSHNGLTTNPNRRGQKGNYPNTTVPLLSGDGATGGYQFGSTFKMFTMLTALDQGMPLDTTINTVSPYISKYIVQPGPGACGDKYCPVNASKADNGPRNMWDGFGLSVNTYFVPLEERVGAQNVVNTARSLGLTFTGNPKQNGSDAYLANNAEGWGAFTLGVSATTPLQMANAYATVAADGKYCQPLPVTGIVDFGGHSLDVAKPQCKQVISTDVARAAADAARCPVGDHSPYGTCHGGTATGTESIVDRPIAGKTGTTDSDKTAALISMTKQLAIAGILADPDNPQTNKHYSHSQVNSAVAHTLHDALVGKPVLQFIKPSQHIAYGTKSGLPSVACQSVSSATNRLTGDGFSVHVDQTPVSSSCPAGTVARSDPSGSAPKGSVVTLYISKGSGGTPNGTRTGGTGGGGGVGGKGPGSGPGNGPGSGPGSGPGTGGTGGGAAVPTCVLFCEQPGG